MHHVLYEWSELVEIDKHVTQLDKGIEAINQAIKSCNLTENKDYTEPLYRVRSELNKQLNDILAQFPDYSKQCK